MSTIPSIDFSLGGTVAGGTGRGGDRRGGGGKGPYQDPEVPTKAVVTAASHILQFSKLSLLQLAPSAVLNLFS